MPSWVVRRERESQIQAWQPLVCGLLKICRWFGIEQNDPGFMKIQLFFSFWSFVILAFGVDLLSSILRMFPAFQWQWPRDLFQANEWSFLVCSSSNQTSHNHGWRIWCYKIVFISEGLVMSFSHTPDRYWYTVRCGYQNGALIPIEGVKNTRKGGFELGFPN